MFGKKLMTWIGGGLLAVAIPAVGATAHHVSHLKTKTAKPTALVATSKTAVKTVAHKTAAKPLVHKRHSRVHGLTAKPAVKLTTTTLKPAAKLTTTTVKPAAKLTAKPAAKLTTNGSTGVTSMHSGHSSAM